MYFLNCFSLLLEIKGETRVLKMTKLSKTETEQELNILMLWVTEQLQNGYVPKFTDVVDYAHRILKFTKLKKFQITRRLRLHPAYLMNSSQARRKFRGGKSRPIVVNETGHLHGDLGYYSINSVYPIPPKFRSGYLVCKDILSRFTYVSVLEFNRKADSMIRAFKDIFRQFRLQNNGMMVKSIGFDLEPSVMSKKVQAFFKEKSVSFHGFANTNSKSKLAEISISQIRTTLDRLSGNIKNKERRWWHLIKPAVNALNNRPIEINKKYLMLPEGYDHPYYTPNDVNSNNLKDFISKIQKANSSYYWSQYEISTRGVTFKFAIGDFIRPKLIVISSEVIGIKRSEVSLSDEIFIVKKQILYVSRTHTVERAYLVKSVATGKLETFSEDEISETVNPFV